MKNNNVINAIIIDDEERARRTGAVQIVALLFFTFLNIVSSSFKGYLFRGFQLKI